MKINLFIFASLIFLANAALAYPPIAPVRTSDDRHLSPPPARRMVFGEALVPDSLQNNGVHSGASVQFLRLVKNQPTPVPGLRFNASIQTRTGVQQAELITDVLGRIEIPVCDSNSLNLKMQFKEGKYGISSRSQYYTLQVTVPCRTKTLVIFKEDSPAGQVIAIHQVIQRSLMTLAQVSDFKFWQRPIRFIFPGDGDYYTNDQVTLTQGHHWDVVAHEMGHAIYDQAVIGNFGGGSHKIDECYSSAMALSEGWASFFAGWTHVDLKDSDAKFEYLVPRRAPIRFENVPSDVCGKSTNEWRVTAFFWDLIDVNADGEISKVAAKKLWDDTLTARAPSVKVMAERLISRGWNRDQVIQVWKINFPLEN